MRIVHKLATYLTFTLALLLPIAAIVEDSKFSQNLAGTLMIIAIYYAILNWGLGRRM